MTTSTTAPAWSRSRPSHRRSRRAPRGDHAWRLAASLPQRDGATARRGRSVRKPTGTRMEAPGAAAQQHCMESGGDQSRLLRVPAGEQRATIQLSEWTGCRLSLYWVVLDCIVLYRPIPAQYNTRTHTHTTHKGIRKNNSQEGMESPLRLGQCKRKREAERERERGRHMPQPEPAIPRCRDATGRSGNWVPLPCARRPRPLQPSVVSEWPVLSLFFFFFPFFSLLFIFIFPPGCASWSLSSIAPTRAPRDPPHCSARPLIRLAPGGPLARR